MSGELSLRNRQRTRAIDTGLLKKIIRELLSGLLKQEDFDLTIQLVNAQKMTGLNGSIMQHSGSTDVITLDYSDPAAPGLLAGELFVCVDEALIQAKHFKTSWTAELTRYIVHGVLHLQGHDDLKADARRRMKREETRLVKELSRRFSLSKLARKPKVTT